jgi:CubicO group peptidase (beta-lactamase class C family)
MYEEEGMVEFSMSDVSNGSIATGIALAGGRPIYVVRYQGFQWYNLVSIVNYAAKSKEICNRHCPIFVRSIAMEGGVGGHAGIFSNSMDVAKMMQLFLQKGNYGDVSYFSSKTFDDFNTCHFCNEGNRRGLGFDKPQLSGAGPTCDCVPMVSFGHTGFTGTIAWADPENEIVYVFLSNRTFPEGIVNKLSKENIREDIQKVIYEAIVK